MKAKYADVEQRPVNIVNEINALLSSASFAFIRGPDRSTLDPAWR
jgi:hypothetical protein